MIKTKTLFILGAGASAPFQYPIGIELRKLICGQSRRATVIQALKPVNEDEGLYVQKVDNFITEFSRSSLYSIDFFLERRQEFMHIGKMAIASYLFPCEKDEILRESVNNWYMYLYNRLKSSFEDFDENKISFITFNYDRSLEQFLFEALKSQFNKSPQECTEKMQKVPIVHLYGQLDLLPWQDQNGKEYSPKNNLIERLRAAPKNIKLISDERDIAKSEEFQKAYGLIKNAERIYFLGFSFDETNLKRLDIKLMKNKALIATALGLEGTKQRWVKKYFNSEIRTEIFLFEGLDSLSLLKKDLKIE